MELWDAMNIPPPTYEEDPYHSTSGPSFRPYAPPHLPSGALRMGCDPNVMLYGGHAHSDDMWDDIAKSVLTMPGPSLTPSQV